VKYKVRFIALASEKSCLESFAQVQRAIEEGIRSALEAQGNLKLDDESLIVVPVAVYEYPREQEVIDDGLRHGI